MTDKGLIYKARFDIADLYHKRNHQEVFTTSQQYGESSTHFLMRMIGFCLISYQEGVKINSHASKSEPDLGIQDMLEHYQIWLDVDQPDFDKVLKASRQSDDVVIVTEKNGEWLKEHKAQCERLDNVEVIALDDGFISGLESHLTRKLKWSVTIEADKLAIADQQSYFESTELHPH